MARAKSEYEVEDLYIDRLVELGYDYVFLNNYNDVCYNFRDQFCKLNAKELIAAKGKAEISDRGSTFFRGCFRQIRTHPLEPAYLTSRRRQH